MVRADALIVSAEMASNLIVSAGRNSPASRAPGLDGWAGGCLAWSASSTVIALGPSPMSSSMRMGRTAPLSSGESRRRAS